MVVKLLERALSSAAIGLVLFGFFGYVHADSVEATYFPAGFAGLFFLVDTARSSWRRRRGVTVDRRETGARTQR